jgi:chromosome segregation ATPase
MSSAYDQQIKKLVEHIQTLNQALHERNMQIAHWQQVARTVQDERTRLARGLMDQVRQSLALYAQRFAGLKAENKKLRSYVDHQRLLQESVERALQGQLRYALTRIDELAAERVEWRRELSVSRQALGQYQHQAQEQKGVIMSQQSALGDLRAQLEATAGLSEVSDRLHLEIGRLEGELAGWQEQVHTREQLLVERDQRLQEAKLALEQFTQGANDEQNAQEARYQALKAQLDQALSANVNAQTGSDERAEDLTMLLANSEREVAKLFRELSEERSKSQAFEIRLEATTKEASSNKRKLTKLEKERDSAKGERLTDLQKKFDAMQASYDELQSELTRALKDKTDYMQALEGQKGKLRAMPPSAEQK